MPDSELTSPYLMGGVFAHCIKLKTVKLSENLEYIGHAAFLDCKALESITIPSSVNTLSCKPFLIHYYGPSNPETICFSPFYGSGLKNVIFENPKGWYVTKDWIPDSEVIEIPEEDLSDPVRAAELIMHDYNKYSWFRNQTD